MPENTPQPRWEDQPDGSRMRIANGIRIIDRTTRNALQPDATGIEHLVTWQDEGGRMVVLGLDPACRPVYTTTLYSYL
jgi:hypothetical protein